MSLDARAAARLTLTLVAPPQKRGEAAPADAAGAGSWNGLERAREALAEAGAELVGERALSARASEQQIHGDIVGLRERLAQRLADTATDWSLRPGRPRAGRLLVCDMDSTIISCECVDEIAAILGIKDEIAAITESAMRGELDFVDALKARVARLKGVTTAQLAQVYAERVWLNPGAKTLVATMSAQGARTVLVSGGFTFFTSRVAEASGFHLNQGNELEIMDGALTGEVVEPILGREAKRDTLERHARELRLSADDAVAIGDGANDLEMMRAAGLGIAYRAKPIVEAEADARIVSGDLRSALFFQGIAEEEFVERG